MDILVIVRYATPNDLRSTGAIHRESFGVPPSLGEAFGADIRAGVRRCQVFFPLVRKRPEFHFVPDPQIARPNSHPNLATVALPIEN